MKIVINLGRLKIRTLALLFVMLYVTSCYKESVKIPWVSTVGVDGITAFSTGCYGKIISDGGGSIVIHGICWSSIEWPTLSDKVTVESHEPVDGEFLSYIYQLDAMTKYYVRAYAKNSAGIGYGEQIQFVTLPDYTGQTGAITDIEGHVYKTIGIGSQVWMAENLNVTKYNDGTPIPNVTDYNDWNSLTTGAYCDYKNNADNSKIYGRLYNWHVAASDNPKNVCPAGWHVPNQYELSILPDVRESTNLGGKLKETGTIHWESPNAFATNETGFTALPGGLRGNYGIYEQIGKMGFWWSSTKYYNPPGFTSNAWHISLVYIDNKKGGPSISRQHPGFSIRCIKDNI